MQFVGAENAGQEGPGGLIQHQGMDLETVKARLRAKYYDVINSAVALAEAHQVTDDATEAEAVENAGQAKRFFKAIEGERKKIIEAPDSFVRGVNAMCKTYKDLSLKVERTYKDKIGQHQWKKELDRREKEKKLQEEARKLQAQAEKEAKKKGVEPVEPMPAPVIKRETVTRTESGTTASIRMKWTFKVTDINKVPREWLVLDERRVQSAIDSGVRNIEGIEIFEKAITVVRT